MSKSRLDRREMLAALLGLPMALSGCSSEKPLPPQLTGQIVGPSDTLGHRLRKAERPSPAADAWQTVGVVIVGGGIAGLAAAWRLQKAGFHDFTVIEMESQPGGTSASGSSDLVAYPWAAHYLPVPMKENRALVSLLDEMGILEGRDAEGEPVVAEQFLCRDPQERVFYMGRWYEGLYLNAGASAADRAQLAAFMAEMDRWAGWRDGRGRRAFALPIATGSDDAEVTALDRLTMAQWLDQHGWTSPRLRWLVDYSCRDDYGTHSEDTSAWAGIFYFASRIRRPGFRSQPLITWPEGNGRIVAHLYGQVQDRVRLGWLVADIRGREQGARSTEQGESQSHALLPAGYHLGGSLLPALEVVMLDRTGNAVRGLRAEQVIFAAPQFLAGHIIRDYRQSPPAHVREFEYAPWLVANLFLHGRPAGRGFPQPETSPAQFRPPSFPLAWDNVLYESPSLGYVVATHQTDLDRGPTVLTYYHAFADGPPQDSRAKLLAMDWESCADLVLSDLARAHPDIRTLVDRLDVMRWGHGMIRPRPGFCRGPARKAAAQPYRGIHFANTDLSGVALVEEAFYHGLRAAEEVLSARRIEFKSLLG
jgi:hypothetical protein